MFTVPYDTMALIHAKRVVADSTILFAVNLLMAEYDVSDAIRRQLSVCEEAKFEVTYPVVVRHLRKGLSLGQPAAAIRTALPATASADPEPLTSGL